MYFPDTQWLTTQGKALATLGFERVVLPLDSRMIIACPEAVFRAAVDTSMPLYEIGLDSKLRRVYIHWTDLFFHVDEEHLGAIETTCVEAALDIARFAPFPDSIPFPGTGYSDEPLPAVSLSSRGRGSTRVTPGGLVEVSDFEHTAVDLLAYPRWDYQLLAHMKVCPRFLGIGFPCDISDCPVSTSSRARALFMAAYTRQKERRRVRKRYRRR